MEVGAGQVTEAKVEAAPAAKSPLGGLSLDLLLKSPAFLPGVALVLGLVAAFWPLIKVMPELWLSEDGYYSHGFLVPLISGYVIYRWWNAGPRLWSTFASLTAVSALAIPVVRLMTGSFNTSALMWSGLVLVAGGVLTGLQYLVERSVFVGDADGSFRGLSSLPVRPFWPALILFLPIIWILRPAYIQEIDAFLSFLFLLSLMFGVWFVAGGRWMIALSLPIVYLAFALPIWTMIIDIYLNPLQIISTDVAYSLLKAFALNPYRDDVTTILLNRFTLNVAVPCSGLKLVLALTAFTFFFVLIAKLKWWGNLAMVLLVIPLALFINGLRIALIGVVGNEFGHEAGMAFHDYSGFITLILCFIILFQFARLLGWKE